ncbi:unnamed protein product [Strongylus vulgaris]|uniref:Uncharacterized protein n=1 Tax=Strongylus vulgaris TaxID=40348 RepID=A0A3P7KWH0_STRVU|nr:unnamed protein product [Strongylus vulgaris]
MPTSRFSVRSAPMLAMPNSILLLNFTPQIPLIWKKSILGTSSLFKSDEIFP